MHKIKSTTVQHQALILWAMFFFSPGSSALHSTPHKSCIDFGKGIIYTSGHKLSREQSIKIQPSTFEQTILVHYTRQRHGPSLIFRHNSAQNPPTVVRCTMRWTPHKLWFPFIQIHTAQSTASLHSDRNTSTHTWSFVTWQQPLQSIWIWRWGLVFFPTSYVFLWFLLSLFHVVSSCCTVADDQSYFLEISLFLNLPYLFHIVLKNFPKKRKHPHPWS